MSRVFAKERGFLTIAQNNSTTNYLELAYQQAKNIKETQEINSYAVIIDKETSKLITDRHKKLFDYIIVLALDYADGQDWKLNNEWQTFYLTPFRETIKLESDLIFTSSIDHWWTSFRLRDVVFSKGCRTYTQEISDVRKYRKFFDDNNLPDIYTGLFYFRYSQTAIDLFKTVKEIYKEWPAVSTVLKNCKRQAATDEVFAIAAEIIGEENCTIATMDFINFVHMKAGIQGWSDAQSWIDYAIIEKEDNIYRISNTNQYHPIHYYDKDFFDELS